jgi:Na+-transporting NADH:ubiquinone oxidoreductase subunit A
MPMDCNFHGEERACINCGYCAEVCPVDILPQFTYKSILTDEIEEALAHGLLDCVECGLCTYVCPCKIELCDTLKNTKKAYYLEQI